MKINRGRGWEDQGPTGLTATHVPADVRMPFKTFAKNAYSGHSYGVPDKDVCHIDTVPSSLGREPEEDKTDDSRHGGTLHIWNAHQHAVSTGTRGGGGIPRGVDMTISVPHADCSGHLPDNRVPFAVRTGESMRLYWEAVDAATL